MAKIKITESDVQAFASIGDFVREHQKDRQLKQFVKLPSHQLDDMRVKLRAVADCHNQDTSINKNDKFCRNNINDAITFVLLVRRHQFNWQEGKPNPAEKYMDSWYWANISDIAEEIDINRNLVRVIINALVEIGYLVVKSVPVHIRGKLNGKSYAYCVLPVPNTRITYSYYNHNVKNVFGGQATELEVEVKPEVEVGVKPEVEVKPDVVEAKPETSYPIPKTILEIRKLSKAEQELFYDDLLHNRIEVSDEIANNHQIKAYLKILREKSNQ